MIASYFTNGNFLKWICAAFGYKRPILQEAKEVADRSGKPLLNAGCGSSYTELSDVNLDIDRKRVPNFVLGDIQNLWMFGNKQFGAAYVSHVIEHVDEPEAALQELSRVAEEVFIITPLPIWPSAWLDPDHKWIFWGIKKLGRIPRFLRKVHVFNRHERYANRKDVKKTSM
jgi:SAM-dependent methyltransferase